MKTTVCGLGRMGMVFARALVERGHEVTVWNRTPKSVDGARTAATAAEAARDAEIVVVMVFDGPASEDVLFGQDGIVTGASAGTLIVNATTLSVEESIALSARARGEGLRYLEAPVAGSVPVAEAGKLLVLVGGDRTDADQADDILSAWSYDGARRYCGEIGAGTGLKLVANTALGSALAAARDAIRLGADLGLDNAAVLDVIARGPLANLLTAKQERFANERFADADFTLAALGKDLRLAMAAADGPLPAAEAAEMMAAGVANRDSDDLDVAAIAAWRA